MLLFGHPLIQNALFYHVNSIDAIENTPPSGVILTEFDRNNTDILLHAHTNNLPLCVGVTSITELIIVANLNPHYILIPNTLVKQAQEIANEYLFDPKLLTIIQDEEEIEELATLGLGGAVFSSAIIKINS